MPIDRDSISNNLRLHLDNNPRINGITKFKSDLERDYFSRITVRNCNPTAEIINLIIELDCPLDLSEMLLQLKKGNWARTQKDPFTEIPISPLDNALFELQLLNDPLLDVEEFSIFLDDCSIIIKKIYHQSIQEQLVEIFEELCIHLEELTKNIIETPSEIYIPVFEEDLFHNDVKIANIEQANNDRVDYFKYWGLYFDNQEDAAIYELGKRCIFNGELYMLNH